MVDPNDDFATIFNRLNDYKTISYEEYKYGFIIVKPNGARHLQIYINELNREKFDIIGFFCHS